MPDVMRTVIVTGGSRGIGLGLARRLVRSGFQVVVLARRMTEGLAAAMTEAAPGHGAGRLHFQACDLSEVERLPEMVKGLHAVFGPMHGLVNNAALGTPGVLATMRDDEIGRLVQLNTLMPIVLTKCVVRSMMSRSARDGAAVEAAGDAGVSPGPRPGSGRIVTITSVAGQTGYSGLSVYSATKASMAGFTRSLARELGPLGITVNAVAPGFIDTDMTSGMDAAARKAIERRSALRRMPVVEDVADMVDFLFSEKARNITGTVMPVDAGNTA